MALKGIKVLELAGLAPVPFCGMVLAEFGASVIRVDKVGAAFDFDCIANGKKSISVNLKNEKGIEILKRLSENSDVLIEPFRKGVMEKLGLGPEVLLKQNKRLVYARLTGFGQKGVLSERAGHDINYAAMTGLLSMFGWSKNNKPSPPLNILADFAGGGLMCALGIIMALFEREKSGCGQIVDCAMVAGSAYLGSWIYRGQHFPIWGNQRGENLLDGGASFYDTYETKDGKFMAVGAIEPKFYSTFLEGLGISEEEVPQYTDVEKSRHIFQSIFRQKSQEEWCKIFDGKDACVTPVLTPKEAFEHKHNAENDTFILSPSGIPVPKPSPVLSRTPAETSVLKDLPSVGQHTEKILTDLGYTKAQIDTYEDLGVIMRNKL